MEQKLGKCGIDCNQCNAYKATMENSDELRKKTADEWSRMFGAVIDPASINCGGCQGEGALFSHCQVCGIRSCASEKGHQTCADCPDYGCEKVSAIWAHDDNIRKNLEPLRG
ncbi:DUF3795 domain-containing protein [Oceanispirochaeta sp.]|jgi:uncharacterized CHY-type Zn-finger protein|uniref:DUF3795 domain-containing protein n=1 Tax=Oceanispirochaeta sp. TaxID=2035350 RepID=UPI002616A50B|nr:DUF3795 domain-containing protein [Oceanispirochaeta sp.]MDA3958188.1 DUF3795 domain-containing protein [Oceanispirochaeta sp.]